MRGWLVLLVLLGAPFAAASNVLSGLVCVDGVHEGPVNLDGGYCQASACDPGAYCEAQADLATACGANVTPQGETCQTSYGGGFGLAVAGAPVASVGAHGVLTNGNATRLDLANLWESDAAEASARAGPVDVGTVTLGLYTSTVYGTDGHAYRHASVEAWHGADGATAGVVLLELAPVGCFVRTSAGDVDCPRVPALP